MDLSSTPFLTKEETLPESDIEENQAATSHENRLLHRRSRFLSPTIKTVTIILAVWGFISLFIQFSTMFSGRFTSTTPDVYRPSTLPPDLNLCDCGRTIKEALSKNCVYDSLATAWLPPYCRDEELTAEFDLSGPGADGAWPYFADKDGKIPITKAQIAALGPTEGVFWARRDWHVSHCFFYWQKYIRMRDTGAVMERRFDMIAHVKHCGRLAMYSHPNHSVLIEVPVMMNSRIVEH